MSDNKEAEKLAYTTPVPPVVSGSSDAEPQGKSPEPTTPAPTTRAPPAAGRTPPSNPPDETAAPPTVSSTILPPQHWQQPAGELADDADDADDADSTLENDQSSTASISSSILKYRTILGRTFHSEQGNAHYWGTNDEPQSEVMDIFHHIQTLGLEGKLFLAPLSDKIQKAVDIGTGTGIWAIDFADEFPGCEVIGTDISPIQSPWVPPNVEFQIDDCTREWTFAENSLDYVHVRFLAGCIPDWSALFKEAYRCLKPGGYLESMEPSPYIESDDGTVDEGSAMSQWGHIFVKGGQHIGRSFTLVQDETQNKAMVEAGFVDIQEKKFKSPIGGWPKDERLKEIGQFSRFSMQRDIEGLILFMTNVLGGWSEEEIQVYIAHLRREIRSGKKHGWYWQKAVWARKPPS